MAETGRRRGWRAWWLSGEGPANWARTAPGGMAFPGLTPPRAGAIIGEFGGGERQSGSANPRRVRGAGV